MNYIKINGAQYPAKVIGYSRDQSWGLRESRHITLEMGHDEAAALFADGLVWSTVQERGSYVNGDGETVELSPIETDCSDFCVAGPITDHRDGTVTVKMGRMTDGEMLAELMEVLNDEEG